MVGAGAGAFVISSADGISISTSIGVAVSVSMGAMGLAAAGGAWIAGAAEGSGMLPDFFWASLQHFEQHPPVAPFPCCCNSDKKAMKSARQSKELTSGNRNATTNSKQVKPKERSRPECDVFLAVSVLTAKHATRLKELFESRTELETRLG